MLTVITIPFFAHDSLACVPGTSSRVGLAATADEAVALAIAAGWRPLGGAEIEPEEVTGVPGGAWVVDVYGGE
jgi:hypothetical protein